MSKSCRKTKQKKLILDILNNTVSHPTANWIYEQAQKEIPGISLGTIYRNLSILKENGEIMELNYGSTFSRYDANNNNHYHFMCEKCGQVFDLDLELQIALEDRAEEICQGKVISHRLEFYGVCKQCLQEENDKTIVH